jgi:hypothetical protein
MGSTVAPYMASTSVRPSVCDGVSGLTVCHIIQFGIGVPYQKLSSKCEFRENRHSGRLAFKEGVYEFLPN